MTTQPLSNGTTFAGRYRVVRHIASGGMGDVYEGVHLETDRNVALKVMPSPAAAGDDMPDRFRREARVTAKIQSEHLVQIFDAGVDEATEMPFLVMELLEGEDVGARIERAGRVSPGEVVTVLHQTALAIDKMHKAGIVHRDLKPENIFLTQRDDGSPRVKVLDFGIAKILAGQADQVTTTHELLGTPLYMAPEQFRAGVNVSPAADIYSLGMLAYTMLAGQPFWKPELEAGASLPVLASKIMSGRTEAATARASRLGVALPRAFDAWFSKAAAPSPGDRFATAQSAVSALADALGVPRPARQEQPPPLPRDVRPQPALSTPLAWTPSAPKSQAAKLPSSSRTASSGSHFSLVATAPKIFASRRSSNGRRKLELAVILGTSLAIGMAVVVVRSQASAPPAPVNAAEPRPETPDASAEASSSQPVVAPAPAETKEPGPPASGAGSGAPRGPSGSSAKESKGAGTGSGAAGAHQNGAAAEPKKKSSEGGSPTDQMPPPTRSTPYIHGSPE